MKQFILFAAGVLAAVASTGSACDRCCHPACTVRYEASASQYYDPFTYDTSYEYRPETMPYRPGVYGRGQGAEYNYEGRSSPTIRERDRHVSEMMDRDRFSSEPGTYNPDIPEAPNIAVRDWSGVGHVHADYAKGVGPEPVDESVAYGSACSCSAPTAQGEIRSGANTTGIGGGNNPNAAPYPPVNEPVNTAYPVAPPGGTSAEPVFEGDINYMGGGNTSNTPATSSAPDYGTTNGISNDRTAPGGHNVSGGAARGSSATSGDGVNSSDASWGY